MIKHLNFSEESLRNIYLKKLVLGEIQGPLTGKASIDKPWFKFYEDEYLIEPFPKMSMYRYLIECNKDNMDGIALDYYGNKITYKRLIEEIDETAKSFVALGIKSGDVVTVGAPFLPETIYSIYALNKIGAVANLIDPRVPDYRLKEYMMGANSKYLVTLDMCFPKVESIMDDFLINSTIYISPNDSLILGMQLAKKAKDVISNYMNNTKGYSKDIKRSTHCMSWKEFKNLGRGIDSIYEPRYSPNMPAVIVYTSGTSGEPKGAISSNESLNNVTIGQQAFLTSTNVGDKFLLIMPPFIAYGLAIGMHGQLCKGQTLVMVPNFNIDNSKEMLGKLIRKHKPQTIMGVPSFMVDLIGHPALSNLDCSFLKNVIVGGDSMVPSAEELVNSFLASKRSSAIVRKGWGMTEVESAATYTRDDIKNPIGSVGIPLPGNNIKIVKCLPEDCTNIDVDELEELNYDEEGEIFITSRASIIDYLNNPEESKRVFYVSKRTGEIWIRSKDLGKMSSDGFLYISGRMKRIIVRPDGHNISPFAIENIINSHKEVSNCAVVAHKSEADSHGSFAVAYIQLKKEYLDRKLEILKEIKDDISRQLPPRDVASYFEFVDELPLTNIGKVDYKDLENREKVKVRVKR